MKKYLKKIQPNQKKKIFFKSFLCSHQFRKVRKMYTPSTHDLVDGVWVGTNGREAALPSFV